MTLARGLGIQVTAEGIETRDQLEYLRGQGVDLVQGYLLGKPAPADLRERIGDIPAEASESGHHLVSDERAQVS
jgi:EAL domain-containing protein (putative c-di-GMP-specific phosphodiesterase class I)